MKSLEVVFIEDGHIDLEVLKEVYIKTLKEVIQKEVVLVEAVEGKAKVRVHLQAEGEVVVIFF